MGFWWLLRRRSACAASASLTCLADINPYSMKQATLRFVFNGEIYNFRQLRKTLEGRGHSFRTHSDTEVIVHAYEEWGEQCLRELRGMFAFAIWDARSSARRPPGEAARRARILLARDRLGIKPLYYCSTGGALSVFLRSAFAAGQRPDPAAPLAGFAGGLSYCSVPWPSPPRWWKEFSRFPPGIAFLSRLTPRRRSRRRNPIGIYSDAVLHQEGPKPKNFQDAAKQLRPLLEETVRDHLIADVPLGVFLSSGLDSTALVALASRFQSDLHTFTVVFPEQRFSEAKVSRETAKHFKTRHEEVLLAPEHAGRPAGGRGQVAGPAHHGWPEYLFRVAGRAPGRFESGSLGTRQRRNFRRLLHVRVDSRGCVCGRTRPLDSRLRSAASRPARPSGSPPAMRCARPPQPGVPQGISRTRIISRGCCSLLPACGACSRPISIPREYTGSHDNPWRERMRETARQAARLDSFTSVSCFELQSYMVNTLLRDTDAASMANSLEVRVPFLDHRLVEFVGRLPKEREIHRSSSQSACWSRRYPTCCRMKSSANRSGLSLCHGRSGSAARSACACRRNWRI